jgi:hypothetical protein
MWEHIKYAVNKVENRDGEIPEEDICRMYLNNLLCKLLSGKYQCFIVLDDDRTIGVVSITSKEFNRYTEDVSVHLLITYAFKARDIGRLKECLDYIGKYAKSEGCNKLITSSPSSRVWKLCGVLGFKEQSRTFVLDI